MLMGASLSSGPSCDCIHHVHVALSFVASIPCRLVHTNERLLTRLVRVLRLVWLGTAVDRQDDLC
eukprot:COSAG02_NODE_1987_length_10178_cov_66.992216_1_plen_64_part_10